MKLERIGRLRNNGRGLEGSVRIDGKLHRIVIAPNDAKRDSFDADFFVLEQCPEITDILRKSERESI